MTFQWLTLFFFMLQFTACWASKPAHDGDRVSVTVCGTKLLLEVARSPAAHARGYMNRNKGPEGNDGMLFIFEDEIPRQFWMKNVRFPLDILFFDSRGAFVKSHTMPMEHYPVESAYPRYPSVAPAQYAIEVRAGWIKGKVQNLGLCQLELTPTIRSTN